MQDFFSQIDSIKGNISFIHASTTQVGGMKEKVCAQIYTIGKSSLSLPTIKYLVRDEDGCISILIDK